MTPVKPIQIKAKSATVLSQGETCEVREFDGELEITGVGNRIWLFELRDPDWSSQPLLNFSITLPGDEQITLDNWRSYLYNVVSPNGDVSLGLTSDVEDRYDCTVRTEFRVMDFMFSELEPTPSARVRSHYVFTDAPVKDLPTGSGFGVTDFTVIQKPQNTEIAVEVLNNQLRVNVCSYHHKVESFRLALTPWLPHHRLHCYLNNRWYWGVKSIFDRIDRISPSSVHLLREGEFHYLKTANENVILTFEIPP